MKSLKKAQVHLKKKNSGVHCELLKWKESEYISFQMGQKLCHIVVAVFFKSSLQKRQKEFVLFVPALLPVQKEHSINLKGQ